MGQTPVPDQTSKPIHISVGYPKEPEPTMQLLSLHHFSVIDTEEIEHDFKVNIEYTVLPRR
jgi:hypothetical protein